MMPTRETHATLVDLLERVLDKGLILDADVIIQVAGIPLLGIKLRAALAGMETMLQYGIWEDWDKAQRAQASMSLATPATAPDPEFLSGISRRESPTLPVPLRGRNKQCKQVCTGEPRARLLRTVLPVPLQREKFPCQ